MPGQDWVAPPEVCCQEQQDGGRCLQAGLQEVGPIEGGVTRGQVAQEAGADTPADQPGRHGKAAGPARAGDSHPRGKAKIPPSPSPTHTLPSS